MIILRAVQLLGIAFFGFLSACETSDYQPPSVPVSPRPVSYHAAGYLTTTSSGEIVAGGRLEQLGVTAYQYGTHRLGGYALQSGRVNLDAYIGSKVIVTGRPVAGYPLDGGPPLLDVMAIEPDGAVYAQ